MWHDVSGSERGALCGKDNKRSNEGHRVGESSHERLRLQQGRDIKAHAREKWGKCSVQWKECEKEKKTHRIHGLNESGDDTVLPLAVNTVAWIEGWRTRRVEAAPFLQEVAAVSE